MESAALRPGATLGRFELRRLLGQGAQSTVWLGYDPRMEREVAIKVVRLGAVSSDAAVAQWLKEARSVARLAHPNIVPVFEADIQGRQPFLVFEYVPGQTLEQVMSQRGALAARAAVALMLDVLDAVVAAHAAGVVHRDLKPSNVLMDVAGHARVMDFGIAARIQGPGAETDAGAGGTIGYLAPEAVDGAASAPSMDVFSAGVVLAELLMGRRLVDEPDPHRAAYRMAHEALTLPKDLAADVDERLRAIVARALARDPAQRYASARELQQALEQWAQPAAPTAEEAKTAKPGGAGTLEFLLRRMRHKSDFPALSEAVVRIQSLARSETESVNSVTNAILKDVALTNKLLRLVNSAHYARGGKISTVSRAVTLVGFNGIRNMAMSLVLLEHMEDKRQAALLKEEFLRSLMAGHIASELMPQARESEEAFIASMFQNLGRMLAQFYFAEEASQIRGLVQATREPLSEEAAAVRVLGLSFEELGLGVAKSWGLPDGIQRCMRKPAGAPPATASNDAGERMRWVALAANDIADAMLHCEPQACDARIAQVTRQYAQAMGASVAQVASATSTARGKLVEMAQGMDLRVDPSARASRLLQGNGTDEAQAAAPNAPANATVTDPGLGRFALHAKTHPGAEAAQAGRPAGDAVAAVLAAGIQDITNAMVEDFKLSDVLRMILETMYRAMGFDRVVFCIREVRTDTVVGRFGLGNGVEKFVPTFRIPLRAATPDLFSVVCNKGLDTMISDATETRILHRLPDWFRLGINAPTFLLLPVLVKNVPFGLIYADKVNHGSLALDEKELALLRTLRNQAVMAVKQSG